LQVSSLSSAFAASFLHLPGSHSLPISNKSKKEREEKKEGEELNEIGYLCEVF
jgi:hypothetical protein